MAQQQSAKNVKWVEGLRGMASVLVIVTHISRAFDYALFFPKDHPEATARLLQLPILRIPWQGRIGVPIFAFLTGFVCALKPLKLSRQGRQGQSDALMAIARSAFRRPPRLVLPAVIATFISFLFTVFGGYVSASHCDSFWVRYDTPNREPTLWREICRFLGVILTTWTNTDNPYDRHQWAMRPLLIGAFQVYVLLAATMGMRFKYRMVVHVLMTAYWWLNKGPYTETFGAMISLGTLLADLSQHHPTQNFIASRNRMLSFVVAPILILTGLFIGSFPQEHEEWASWSRWLQDTFVNMNTPEDQSKGSLLVPEGADPRRRFTALNIQLFALAVFLSPTLREILSNKYLLWLGHHSFAVYLTHGTILRTVGIWIAYGIVPHYRQREDGSFEPESHIVSPTRVRLAVVVFICLTYTAAWAWMRYVDTACARATKWLESRVFESEDEAADKHEAAEKGYSRVQNGDAGNYGSGSSHNGNSFNGSAYHGDHYGVSVTNGHARNASMRDNNSHARKPSVRDRAGLIRQNVRPP